MKIRIFFVILLSGILSMSMMTSCSTKQGAIRQLERLSYDLRDNSSYYTVNDWKAAAEKFGTIRNKMTKYDYTPAERRRIGELEGLCARYMVSGLKNGAINGILGIGSEIRGILESLGIKY